MEPNCLDDFFARHSVITRVDLRGQVVWGWKGAEPPEQKFCGAEYRVRRLSLSLGVMHSMHAEQQGESICPVMFRVNERK